MKILFYLVNGIHFFLFFCGVFALLKGDYSVWGLVIFPLLFVGYNIYEERKK